MKSLFLSFFFSTVALSALTAQGNIPEPTHIVTQITYDPLLPLQNNDEVFNYYDSNGHLYQSKTNTWDGTNWVLYLRTYYTLNAEGKPVAIIEKQWDAFAQTLSDFTRATIEYHANGEQNYRKDETWNKVTGIWETEAVSTTTFTASNNVAQSTNLYYDEGVASFGSRNTYTYDGNDRVSTLIDESYTNGAWVNNQKTEYVYNGAAADYDIAYESLWDENTSTWPPSMNRDIQTITPNQSVIVSEVLDGTGWHPYSRATQNFNANDQLLEFIFENWDESTQVWSTEGRYEFSYNNDQSVSQFRYFLKDFATEILFLFALVDYDYGTYAVSAPYPTLQATASLSPNPTTDVIQVKLEGDEVSNITLLDLRGNVIARTKTAANHAQLSLGSQPAGTYLLRIEQGAKVKVLPVVKN